MIAFEWFSGRGTHHGEKAKFSLGLEVLSFCRSPIGSFPLTQLALYRPNDIGCCTRGRKIA